MNAEDKSIVTHLNCFKVYKYCKGLSTVSDTLTVTAVNYQGCLLPAAKLDTVVHQHTLHMLGPI